jgi:hypothetical protein
VLRTTGGAQRTARQLAPAFRNTVKVEGGVFAAGVGWSAVALRSAASAEPPIALTQLHWAYYALYMVIDRSLNEVLNQSRWSERAPLNRLEDDAEAIFVDYRRIVNARARLDSYLNSRGGDRLAIWQAIARVQGFDAILDAVERKLGALEKLAERRVEQAVAAQARRTAKILGFLTVLTFITVTGGVIGVLFGSRSPGGLSVVVRAVLLVIALLCASVTFYFAFVRTVQRTRTDKRFP